MKVENKGSIFCSANGGKGLRFEFWPIDGSRGGFEHLGTFVKLHTAEFEVMDNYDPRARMVEELEMQIQKAGAEYQKRVTELKAQIQSLLAIEA